MKGGKRLAVMVVCVALCRGLLAMEQAALVCVALPLGVGVVLLLVADWAEQPKQSK